MGLLGGKTDFLQKPNLSLKLSMFANFRHVNALATANFKPQCDISDPNLGRGPAHLTVSLTSWLSHMPASGIFCKMLMWTLENKAPGLLDQETKISTLAFREGYSQGE